MPEWDDRALFEKLVLDGFQAGLSWITILRKRDSFRRAFANFEPLKIARFGDKDIERLLQDPGIVRNRAKVNGAITSSRAYLAYLGQAKKSDATVGPFAELLWGFVGGQPRINKFRAISQLPAESEESRAMSKALRKLGFSFVGPTICYAFMQAVGMVNDHLVTCPRHVLVSKPPRNK